MSSGHSLAIFEISVAIVLLQSNAAEVLLNSFNNFSFSVGVITSTFFNDVLGVSII